MKVKHIVIISLAISIVALMVSVAVLLSNISESNLPKGIKEVEIIGDERKKVTIDSETYYFSLTFFEEYATRFQIKVETSSGWILKTMYVGKTYPVYDLVITAKETSSNSVTLWIEKKEG